MRKINRRGVIVAALLLATFSACSDDQAKKIATNIDRIATLILDGLEIKNELEESHIISMEEGKAISQGLLKVNTAVKVFNSRAKTYASSDALTPAARADLKKLALDISGAATELISNGTFGVRSADAQVRINATIGALKQVTLTIVDTVDLLKTKGGQ